MQSEFLGTYRAIVTSVSDPTGRGYVRVQCPQVAGLAELNWAEPALNPTVLPNIGDIVWIYFNGGELHKPIYSLTKNPYTWITPIYNTNWSGIGGFAGLGGPTLRFRKTRDDEVYFYGNFAAATGALNTVFHLPTGFYNPAGLGMSGTALHFTGGVISSLNFAIDVSTGAFIISGAINSGDQYLVNVRVPMLFTS